MLAIQPALPLSRFTHLCLPPRSEKAKMLSGEPFLPNTAQLADERKLSLQASCRFNNAILQMDSGKRGWLFERIVAAKWIYPCAGEH
jgi:hypothetical protein